ncbi:MAG: HNH endonuclease [Candidatus Brocadiae bacterium]|nr:HNH endonuclease [Candidatus Brocadiia bacterium]
MAVAVASALSANVLVLNKHYAAVRVVTARRAMCMLFKQIAEIVSVEDRQFYSYDFYSWREVSEFRAKYEREEHDWIRCVRFELAVPRIVRLLTYDRFPRRAVKFNRRNIYARDASRCQYCGRKFPTSELSLDHVIPKSRGGHTDWSNVVCCCVSCNVRKGGRIPKEAGLRLVAEPVKPRRCPVITLQLTAQKYASWKQFLDIAYWNVELETEAPGPDLWKSIAIPSAPDACFVV